MRILFLCVLLATAAVHATESATRPKAFPVSEIVYACLDTIKPGAPTAEISMDPALAAGSPENQEASVWLKENASTFKRTSRLPLELNVMGIPLVRQSKGDKPDELILHLFTHHASGKVIIYGLDGETVTKAYWHKEPAKALAIEKTKRDLQVTLTPKNAKPLDPIDTVIVLELSKPPVIQPLTIAPQQDGSLLLHSSEAIVKAKNLRYEPEPNKNTVGYWTLPTDYVQWQFKVEKAGLYEVEMLQGCGKNSGGSTVEVTIDDAQPLQMVVQDTGHFQNFVPRVIGQVKLEPGEHTLHVRVKEKKGVAVMDLRQVVLKPVAR